MPPLIVDLSLDFDFFVRQPPTMPFDPDGQGERAGVWGARKVWWSRYSDWPAIYRETDVHHHADFLPGDLFTALAAKGVELPQAPKRLHARCLAGESHLDAYWFFRTRWDLTGAPDALLHLDSHADVYGTETDDLDCANWLARVLVAQPGDVVRVDRTTHLLWLTPQHMDPDSIDLECCGLHGVDVAPFRDWHPTSPMLIRHVYLARSPVWVPPHLDAKFFDLVTLLRAWYTTYFAWVDHPLKARGYPVLDRTPLLEGLDAAI